MNIQGIFRRFSGSVSRKVLDRAPEVCEAVLVEVQLIL